MGTKTISIMDDVYEMLIRNKAEEESFSDQLRRVISERKKVELKDLFGILSDKEGEEILSFLEQKKKQNLCLAKKRLMVQE